MAELSDAVVIRQIQGVAVLLSSLPADGKSRELYTLALESGEQPWLERIGAPDDADSEEGLRLWFEGLWNPDNLSAEEKRIVDWQNDSDNMTAAIAEFRAIADRVGAS